MTQQVGDDSNATAVALPFAYQSGVMRMVLSPFDNALYVGGLKGWGGGRTDGCVNRLRYDPAAVSDQDSMPIACRYYDNGIEIDWSGPAPAMRSVTCTLWNYQWSDKYGSAKYHPQTNATNGSLKLKGGTIIHDSERTSTIFIPVEGLIPVDQISIDLRLAKEQGKNKNKKKNKNKNERESAKRNEKRQQEKEKPSRSTAPYAHLAVELIVNRRPCW